MATMITEECINCGRAIPNAPTAIYAGRWWELKASNPRSAGFTIVPEKCTECVGHFDQEQCAAVCPVDCCVADPNHVESEEELFTRAKQLHPSKEFADLSATTSHFRK